MVKTWDARSRACLQTPTISKRLDHVSFDISDWSLHNEIGIIGISSLSGLFLPPTISKVSSPQYRGLDLSADGVWIAHDSENIV